MYKPHTIEQYKIQQFLDHTFAMEHFLVSPLSRSALMLEDRCGERIAFSFSDNEVREIPIPSAPSPDKVKSFIRSFRALGTKPHLRTFEDVTRWWLNHPNPLTYQQALGLPDELYRRFLSSTLIEDEDAQRLAASGLVSEDAYQDIQLWYLNGNTSFLDQSQLEAADVDHSGSVDSIDASMIKDFYTLVNPDGITQLAD